MRICATKEKIGCSGVKILYTTREANVLKFTKNYNNEKAIPRIFCELGKRITEYVNKLTEIA
jgi:hypothetical protein